MSKRKSLIFTSLILAVAVFAWSTGDALAKKATRDEVAKKFGKMTPSERKAAAKRGRNLGLKPGVAGLAAQAPDPSGVPHYFGPYGNWAFSPLPKGAVATVTPVEPGAGYSATPTVIISDAYLPQCPATTACYTPANVTAHVTDGAITGFTVEDGGSGYFAAIVTITDATGTDALADAVIGGALTGGMRKFVDKLPGLKPEGANGLGQYIPVAVPETITFSGQQADYYEIALVEYDEKMHSDLPPTRLRGYVQLSTASVPGLQIPLVYPNGTPIMMPDGITQAKAVDKPHNLGPVIVAKGRAHGVAAPDGDPKPVRIKFYNLLPTGTGGDLFIPVDETVMGSGLGPVLPGAAGDRFAQNRATIHLHGNNTVWISDGTPHQWITPASENTPYPKGVSVWNVPDMGTDCDAPGSGCQTFFYTAGSRYFCESFLGIPAQKAAKITRPLMPAAAPAVLAPLVLTQQGVKTSVRK